MLISDQDIIVYGKNPTNGTSDVYLILPVDDIGNDYIAASHRPRGQFTSNIGIVATQPDTEIDITVPNLGRNISVRLGKYNCREGQTLTVALDIYETVQLESNQDLMGVKITANHPFALISGETSQMKLKNSTVVTNHFVHQMIPVHGWGHTFVAGSNSVNNHGYHVIGKYFLPFKSTDSFNNTNIAVNSYQLHVNT